jgi:hypothetical protein
MQFEYCCEEFEDFINCAVIRYSGSGEFTLTTEGGNTYEYKFPFCPYCKKGLLIFK